MTNMLYEELTRLRNLTPMQRIYERIKTANLEECRDIAAVLGNRLFALEKQSAGMKASNINEAAHFMADVLLDLSAATRMKEEAPCTCGKCDECVAARSDEQHDRAQDAIAAEREMAGRTA